MIKGVELERMGKRWGVFGHGHDLRRLPHGRGSVWARMHASKLSRDCEGVSVVMAVFEDAVEEMGRKDSESGRGFGEWG
jgi:hypothetical protein